MDIRFIATENRKAALNKVADFVKAEDLFLTFSM
jgi:hypothetical protein